jgi:nicotinamide-nucleotide amidase
MNALAEKVGQALGARGLRAATAESCTGGWVAQAITAVPGSSQWFVGGFVSYSNAAKQQMLGVKARTLEAHGAVSEQTVTEMAEGGLARTGADICVAISGVAGPDGGSKEKPVGTVWLAWAVRNRPTVSCLSFFQGDRTAVREQAVEQALEGILAYLPP